MTEVTIRRLGHKGDGIADGPVYAPLTLPGEVVTGDLDGQVLTNIRITTPSGDRVSPPCRHFKSCGGCQLQHASDTFLAQWKTDIVRTALEAHGLATEFAPMHISPPRSRRRATLSARRTKKGAMSGFHAKGLDVIVEIPDCTLLHPDLIAARPAVEALAQIGASRKHALSVTLTRSSAGIDAAVQGGKPLDGPLRIALAGLAQTHDLARLSWDGERIVTQRAPIQIFGKVSVEPPPGAFLQATLEGEAALQNEVASIVGGAGHVVDLFAGCGTFALPLAEDRAVHAVEGDATMTEALDKAWRGVEGLRAVTTEARDLFRRPLEPDELAPFDAAVIDPPRAGAEAQVARLAEASIPVLAYVSCNPTSFARDARTLCDSGYRLSRLRVVDQFRWSAHVELVAEFRFVTAS
ncbi:class I SAM-dependent RNA methyltransferase [Roseovarius sp. 2305UL8-3]|uniref:class I SAM-dependent RNA methyltransferase n=1 Tax=Roseovarius conchicola TaxID=3121636 RepID=UPI0035296848